VARRFVRTRAEYNALLKQYFQLQGSRLLSHRSERLPTARFRVPRFAPEHAEGARRTITCSTMSSSCADSGSLPRESNVSSARKRAFLMDSSDGRGPRAHLLLRELALVSKLAAPYGREPTVLNLVGSPRIDSTHCDR
jgi:hypothetical protein